MSIIYTCERINKKDLTFNAAYDIVTTNDETMQMIFDSEELTHELLLHMMPFNSGYLQTEEGKPDQETVMVAIALRALEYVAQPMADPYRKPFEN